MAEAKKTMPKSLSINKKMFNDVYFPYVNDYSYRYNVFYGGRSSGKSYFISDKLILKAVSEKSRQIWCMKTGNKVKKTIWQLGMDSISKLKLTGACTVNKSDFTIEFANGSIIYMIGLDDSEKAKGYVNIDTVWCEECTAFDVDDIDLLDGTIRGKSKHKQMYFSFNPVSKENWVYEYFHFDTGNYDEDTFVLKTTYRDNRWCDEADIKRLEKLKERNRARYEIEANGNFATLDKLVYPNITVADINVLDLLRSENKDIVPFYGMDFGFINDYTALVCAIADTGNKILYIYDEYFKKGMLTKDIIEMVKSKSLHKTEIICDRQEARLIEELNKGGIRCKKCNKGKGSINTGISKIQEYDIIVDTRCENMITEFRNYCYKKNQSTGQYTNEPIDSYNHGMDALRYGIQTVKQKARIVKTKL